MVKILHFTGPSKELYERERLVYEWRAAKK
jgi:hypothetical protein